MPPPRRVPHGVLFDAGGTLVQVHTDRLAEQLRRRGHDPRELDDAFWRTLALLDSEFGPGAGDWSNWFPAWLERMAAASGVPGAVMREAWRAADSELHLWDRPVPGAAECLTRLREAGIRVGVVSNADGRVEGALARAGLAELLEVIVDSGVVGVAKPDPAIFHHALGPLGVAPADAWYLGDTVVYDAAAADAAGLTSWLIDHRGLHTVRHPRRVRSLAEFADAALAGSRGGGPAADRRR
ncbi:MAG TPA: HAD-IA family hydrolase [Egibacteraceae bacterium]|nr:HAD-IA family hydrolase [Egibacteraceae bacterium]